jgi:DNA-directed RNA polymerase specialized sigma24 family protein
MSEDAIIAELISEHTERNEDVGRVILRASRQALKKGRAAIFPRAQHEDIIQETCVRALPRIRRWKPDGRYSIQEYAYCACCFVLKDIARERINRLVEMRQDPLDCDGNFGSDFLDGSQEDNARTIDLEKHIRRIKGDADTDAADVG